MIIYGVTSNNIFEKPIKVKPKQIFIMTRLGENRQAILLNNIYWKNTPIKYG